MPEAPPDESPDVLDASADATAPVGVEARVTLDVTEPVAETLPEFLSFSVDTAQVVGGVFWNPDPAGEPEIEVEPYDFSRARLVGAARHLAPAFLRVSGSACDFVYYDLSEAPGEAPAPYELVMTRAQIDGMLDFVDGLGLSLMFGISAGPGARDESKRWTSENAREMIEYMKSRDAPVGHWELGNEINGFALFHGLDFGLSGSEYAADFRAARALIEELTPGVPLSGPSSAFWPKAGELAPVLPDFLEAIGPDIRAVSWHYYPQQSERCPLQTVRASPTSLLTPERLDEVSRWADQIAAEVEAHNPGAEIWLTESGNAQCGGAPGVSDVFTASFWWLDQLGLLARRGYRTVVRQTLSGSDYGLLDDVTLDPRPDYWASVLWKRLMGAEVFMVTSDQPTLRVYAHCAPGREGRATVLLLNIDQEQTFRAQLDGAPNAPTARYVVSSPEPTGSVVQLGGLTLEMDAQGGIPALMPEPLEGAALDVPPLTYVFVTLEGVTACQ